jgi:hypothetical protein
MSKIQCPLSCCITLASYHCQLMIRTSGPSCSSRIHPTNLPIIVNYKRLVAFYQLLARSVDRRPLLNTGSSARFDGVYNHCKINSTWFDGVYNCCKIDSARFDGVYNHFKINSARFDGVYNRCKIDSARFDGVYNHCTIRSRIREAACM